MLKEAALYYFSPTGGTKKIGEILCSGLAENVKSINLGSRNIELGSVCCDIIVVAAPVFGGRIPKVAIDKIKKLEGEGKKAITLAVYGTRAYEDALLELNHAVGKCGFEIIASAALVAQHSIVPSVGTGRPDVKDAEEIQRFARNVLEKMENGNVETVVVPGNFPYKELMKTPATPICTSNCDKCGVCEAICPTGAIHITEDEVVTDMDKCILCMACVAHCPKNSRILAQAMQEGMNQKLGAFKDVRRENEYFI